MMGGLLKNKWVLIGVGVGALLLIILIVIIITCSRSKDDDEDYKRFSTVDKDMKINNQPYMGLNNDSKDSLINNPQYNGNSAISTPLMGMNSNWNSTKPQEQDSFNLSNTDLLAPPQEPKRITSISFEEQQNYSKIMEKNLKNDKPKSNIPEEYEKFKTYRIVRKFTPQRNDELVVEIGHMVKLIKSFEDGWTLCYNIDTKKEGYIPKNKLAALDKPQVPQTALYSEGSSVNSAYSTKPLLHSNSGNSLNNSYNRENRDNRDRDRDRRGQRPVNNRNNSGRGGPRGSPSQKPGPNKYYRKPSNDNTYINSNYQRSPKQRYDM